MRMRRSQASTVPSLLAYPCESGLRIVIFFLLFSSPALSKPPGPVSWHNGSWRSICSQNRYQKGFVLERTPQGPLLLDVDRSCSTLLACEVGMFQGYIVSLYYHICFGVALFRWWTVLTSHFCRVWMKLHDFAFSTSFHIESAICSTPLFEELEELISTVHPVLDFRARQDSSIYWARSWYLLGFMYIKCG